MTGRICLRALVSGVLSVPLAPLLEYCDGNREVMDACSMASVA